MERQLHSMCSFTFMTLGQKLLDALLKIQRDVGLNETQMAAEIGVTSQTWGNWKARGSVAKDGFEKVFERFPETFFVSGPQKNEDRGAVVVDDERQYDGELSFAERRALSSSKLLNGDILMLPQLSTIASMGYGAALQEHVDVVRLMRVSWGELKRQVRGPITSPENLRILTGYGTSMRPTFNDGDPLLVDIGVTAVDREGVYVLERGSELFVKRMQRMITDGSLLMISDNREEHPYPEKIPRDSIGNEFFVRGRVLMVWNARNL